MNISLKFWMLVAILCISTNVSAQKIKIVDKEGNPIGYASVTNADNGKVIGSTDKDGVMDDVGGVRSIAITHVAFNPLVVRVSELPADGIITMEASNYELDEIEVKPKDFLYVQTYHRTIYLRDDTMYYYRVGLTDNVYEIAKKEMSSYHRHLSKSSNKTVKFFIDMFGGVLDGHSNLQTNNVCINKKNNKKLNVIEETPTRSRLEYSDQCVGYLVDDTVNHQRRMSVDDALYQKLWTRNNKSEKHAEKSEKREERKKNKEDTYYKVYHMDEDGHCGIEDFVASSSKTDYDQYEKLLGKEVHIRMWTEVYSTERAYLDKKELKEKRKENKIELTYESIKQFEREHDIPALPDNALKAIDMIMKK